MLLAIYIPIDTNHICRELIAPGSALIGKITDIPSDAVTVYYEGNLYDAVNLRTFKERASCAAGRLVTKYPTSSLMRVHRHSLYQVGEYGADPASHTYRIVSITDQDRLDEWAGEKVTL